MKSIVPAGTELARSTVPPFATTIVPVPDNAPSITSVPVSIRMPSTVRPWSLPIVLAPSSVQVPAMPIT
jgi:hypothetical protein